MKPEFFLVWTACATIAASCTPSTSTVATSTTASASASSTARVPSSSASASKDHQSFDGPLVIDLKPSDGPLTAQLAREQASVGSRTLVLQTTADWCRPCIELKKHMADARIKRALRGVKLVRIDVDTFGSKDIENCKLSATSIPWFVKLSGQREPIDAISSAEWGDDVPANMAPVLEAFVQGSFDQRKSRWRPGVWR